LWRDFGGQHKTGKKGNAHTRPARGTGTNNIVVTHFSPKHFTTCFCDDRTASRYQPLALIFRPLRRSTVSSAPNTSVAPGGTKAFTSNPSKIFPACRGDHRARFNSR
jgi:hypothetical protein